MPRRRAQFDIVGQWLLFYALPALVRLVFLWPLWRFLWRRYRWFPPEQPGEVADFYRSAAWKQARLECFRRYKQAHGILRCVICGAIPEQPGVVIDCGHIKSRSRWPELALEQSNLTPMCKDCNRPAGNRFMSLNLDYCERKYGNR